MWTDPKIWIGGLVASSFLLGALFLARHRWQTLIDRLSASDGTSQETEQKALIARMERARYLTCTLALLALVPVNPAVFALILRYPKLHALLSIGGIVFVLGSVWKALAKLDLGMLFPTRPSWLGILRSAFIGLCLGFIFALCWRLAVDEQLRRLVIEAWNSK